MSPPTTRLITASAGEVLRPLGLFQKGRSRTWLGDQDWWLLVVEFQPSFGRGNYLNVGVNFLWADRDYIACHVGGRARFVDSAGIEVGGITYESDEQFAPEVQRMVESAAALATLYRSLFASIEDCADYYGRQLPDRYGRDQSEHAAIASALAGRTAEALDHFGRFLEEDDDRDWAVARRADAATLKQLLEADEEAFRAEIGRRTARQRDRFKLPPLASPLWQSRAIG